MGSALEHQRPAEQASGQPRAGGLETKRSDPLRGGAGGGAGAGGGDGGGRALRGCALGRGGSRAPTAARPALVLPGVGSGRCRAGYSELPPAGQDSGLSLTGVTCSGMKGTLHTSSFSTMAPKDIPISRTYSPWLAMEKPRVL
ncbi:dachshund homolog 1-like [Phacochoerus africanus]|uniref:dachshund homolog 1-like n=1 Tax=Phacochoerus africanus TaxID=41426 RepID=UPI001FD9CF08|nr:dachshund homolog 1-like [Phacochoerus africanus]